MADEEYGSDREVETASNGALEGELREQAVSVPYNFVVLRGVLADFLQEPNANKVMELAELFRLKKGMQHKTFLAHFLGTQTARNHVNSVAKFKKMFTRNLDSTMDVCDNCHHQDLGETDDSDAKVAKPKDSTSKKRPSSSLHPTRCKQCPVLNSKTPDELIDSLRECKQPSVHWKQIFAAQRNRPSLFSSLIEVPFEELVTQITERSRIWFDWMMEHWTEIFPKKKKKDKDGVATPRPAKTPAQLAHSGKNKAIILQNVLKNVKNFDREQINSAMDELNEVLDIYNDCMSTLEAASSSAAPAAVEAMMEDPSVPKPAKRGGGK